MFGIVGIILLLVSLIMGYVWSHPLM
jgi:hypothetical protein